MTFIYFSTYALTLFPCYCHIVNGDSAKGRVSSDGHEEDSKELSRVNAKAHGRPRRLWLRSPPQHLRSVGLLKEERCRCINMEYMKY